MEYEPQFKRLRIYNAFMGFLHLIQAAAVLVLSNDFKLPVTTSFLSFDETIGRLWPVTDVWINVPLGAMVAVFLLLSAAAHFIIASPPVFGWYVRNLKTGINYARWYEYSFSASLMIVLIAMLCGVYDLGALLMAFALTAVMNLCGLVMEVHNQTTQRTNWISYTVGCIAGVAPWVAIAIYFFGSLSQADGGVPTFVYVILPTLFVFFFSFALNMVLQYRKVGPWRDYLFGERVYILLSLIAKSALAWQVFAGTLRPV
ncbi:heliorhodopsin HeR [Dehalogenimonas sp. 4OHTPN]|uniref:Heliorhodopsin HeR n=1 Tax=Dehalogenimonas sp. 4OHTPN TaxID=3166643 RepID=A0AAU8GA08_9CHLR